MTMEPSSTKPTRSPLELIQKALKKQGTFSRMQFVIVYIVVLVINMSAAWMLNMVTTAGITDQFFYFATLLAVLISILFSLYLIVQAIFMRLRDIGLSKWYILMAIVPPVISVYLPQIQIVLVGVSIAFFLYLVLKPGKAVPDAVTGE